MFLNKETGELCRPNCNTYGCPECGKRKVAILRKAIIKVLTQWKEVRMWTFTLNHNVGTIEEHRAIYQKVWRIFFLNLRRNKALSKNQREVQYIRVWERCNDGYFHCHVFVNQYLNFFNILNLWRAAIVTVTKCDEETAKTNGGCNIAGKSSLSVEQAANYVTKYVTKQVTDETDKNNRRYSKSNEIILFEYKESDGNWIVLRLSVADFECDSFSFPEALNSYSGRTTAQNDHPPPLFHEEPALTERTEVKKDKYCNNPDLGALAD